MAKQGEPVGHWMTHIRTRSTCQFSLVQLRRFVLNSLDNVVVFLLMRRWVRGRGQQDAGQATSTQR